MFDSGISVKDLVKELKETEVDIALDIPNKTYVEWLNSLQQLLYTEVIKEQKEYSYPEQASEEIPPPMGVGRVVKTFDLSTIPIGENESHPIFEDIVAFYSNGIQFIKSTVASGYIFPNTYFKYNNQLGYEGKLSGLTRIIYYVRPALITVDVDDNIDGSKVMLPVEFIDLAKSKLRGEAYKLVNEDGIAGKWLNDYNILLETFKAWISEKTSTFGI